MSEFELITPHRTFTPEALRGLNEDWIRASYDQDFGNALLFCHHWFRGKQRFDVSTSGSTGKSKQILFWREQMIASAELTAQALGLVRGDRALACLSCQRIAGLMMLVRGMHLGLRLYLVKPSRNPLRELSTFYSGRIDFIAVVPMQLSAMAHDGYAAEKLDKMKAILVGGAPITGALARQVNQLKAPVYHTFGMTETASHIALRRLNGNSKSELYRCLPGVVIELSEKGCLKVMAEMTGNRWVETNDLVELLSTREFNWLGRYDNVINSGGVKIYPERIEKILSEVLVKMLPGGAPDFFVAGLPDEELGERVVVIIEGHHLSPELEQQLLREVAQFLRRYEVPKSCHYVAEFSRVGDGKVDRAKVVADLALQI